MIVAKPVSLRRNFVPKARPISNLLEILQQSVAPQPIVSSPIETFSSPRPSDPPSTDPSVAQYPSSATLVALSNKVTPSKLEASYNEQTPSSPYEPPASTFPSHHVPALLTSSKTYDPVPALGPPNPDDDDDDDDDDMLHPDELVARGIAKSKENDKEKENLARARALKMQALELQGIKDATTSMSAFSGIASEEDDLEFDVAGGSTVTSNSLASEGKAKGRQPQSFLDDTISRVKKPRTQGVARADPFGSVVISKQAHAGRKPKAKDPMEAHRVRLLTLAGLNATETRRAKEADWVARGGTLKDAQAPKGPMLEEILEIGTERIRQIEQRREHGQVDSGDDEDQEGEDYQPPENSDYERDGSPQPLRPLESTGSPIPLSPSSSSESHASGSSPLFQRTEPVDGSPSHTSPTSTSEDDAHHEMHGVSSLARRRKPKKSVVRRVVSDDEDDEAAKSARPTGSGADSDAENARPMMDDSDLENIPPPVVQQVSTGLEDDDIANRGRGPLKPLSSFSSSMSLSSMSGAFGKPLGALSEDTQRPFTSVSLRCGPLAELRESTRQADENVGETDFGFGGMSQLFEATQSMQSQIKPVSFTLDFLASSA